jgi:hypothetical protein
MRITRFAALLTLVMAAAPTLTAATRITPDANAGSSLASATKLPANMELRASLHSGVSNPLKAVARPFITCWADIGYPGQVGSNVVSYNNWQCSAGIEQQISLVASLTYQDGTRYQFTKTCYYTQSCSYNPMTAPYRAGTWTAKADYAYVVYGDGTSGYWWGGQIAATLP